MKPELFIKFDLVKLREFKAAYEKCARDTAGVKQAEFTFEDRVFDREYAKYLIEYLELRLSA